MSYSGSVIDTHHHIWLRKDVGWLADPPIPRMFGDYFGIRRDYPLEEFLNDVKPQGVTKSVHVTAMWGPDRALHAQIFAIHRNFAAALRCLRSTICISNCRFMPGRWPMPSN